MSKHSPGPLEVLPVGACGGLHAQRADGSEVQHGELASLIESAPTLAARLDEAVGLLRGIMHCSPAFDLAPSAATGSLLGRIEALLAAIDAESAGGT